MNTHLGPPSQVGVCTYTHACINTHVQCWSLGTQPGQPARTHPYVAQISSSSIVGLAQLRWSPTLSLPQPQMVAMACTAQETFLLNMNSKVLAGAEPLRSHRVTVVHTHVFCDRGSGGLSGDSKTGCQWYKLDAEGRRHTRSLHTVLLLRSSPAYLHSGDQNRGHPAGPKWLCSKQTSL